MGMASQRIGEIDAKLARLQAQYESKLAVDDPLVPPQIKKSALDGIAKRMDRLDAERLTLLPEATWPELSILC